MGVSGVATDTAGKKEHYKGLLETSPLGAQPAHQLSYISEQWNTGSWRDVVTESRADAG